ncbi:hypothetical protein [Aureimonas sp. D3]|uniref:hypothetical protein n=1 Tax=Aureimonas sp. D3 TaxID=1638164 RepID=UPI0012E3311C|nr:hypothetical protein [Aureimonas sp. D3]
MTVKPSMPPIRESEGEREKAYVILTLQRGWEVCLSKVGHEALFGTAEEVYAPAPGLPVNAARPSHGVVCDDDETIPPEVVLIERAVSVCLLDHDFARLGVPQDAKDVEDHPLRARRDDARVIPSFDTAIRLAAKREPKPKASREVQRHVVQGHEEAGGTVLDRYRHHPFPERVGRFYACDVAVLRVVKERAERGLRAGYRGRIGMRLGQWHVG